MKKFTLIILSMLIITLVALYAWPAPKPISHVNFDNAPQNRVEIIAHGGGQGHAPPNTIFALTRAVEMGADVLEVDVQQTQDGVLVLRHDATLDRTTNMTGKIADKTWAQINQADAGANTIIQGTDYKNQGITIPRLDAALATFPDARWVIEIKNDTQSAAITMCSEIKATNAESRVLVGSFHDAAMQHFRRACPQIATSMASTEVRNFVIAAHLGLSRWVKSPAIAMQIPMTRAEMDLTHPRIINAAHQRGIRLQYWTINTPQDMNMLIKAGADGIITDYVDMEYTKTTN